MLGQALPGLRELRAPLVAGYLWLLFLWVVVGDSLPTRDEAADEGGPLARLFRVGDFVQDVGLALAVSVVALLVGSLATSLTQSIARARARASTAPPDIRELLERIGVDELNRSNELRAVLERHEVTGDEFLRESQETGWRVLIQDAPLLKTGLLARSESLHSQVDRPDAEAALRLATVAPLASLLIYLAVADSLWWALGLIFAGGLLWQGVQLRRTARATLATAIHSVPELRAEFAATVADRMFGDRLADIDGAPNHDDSSGHPHESSASRVHET